MRVDFPHLKTVSPTLTADQGLQQSAKVAHFKKGKDSFILSSLHNCGFSRVFLYHIWTGYCPLQLSRTPSFIRHLPLCSLPFSSHPLMGVKTIPDIHGKLGQQAEKSRERFNNTALACPPDARGGIILLWKFVR